MATITSHNEEEKQKQKKMKRKRLDTAHQHWHRPSATGKKGKTLKPCPFIFLESARSARPINQLALVLAQDQGGIGTTKAKAIGHDRGQLSLTGRGDDINPVTV